MVRIPFLLSLAVVLLVSVAGHSEELQTALSDVMTRWAHIKYEVPEGDRADLFAALAEDANRLTKLHPDRAEPKVWEAIVRASYAGSMGGLRSVFSALPEVKRARELLEAAKGTDPEVLEGSVYTSLGSLYYQVPGSPIGFGDGELARVNLEKALDISPAGIDPNFFMGDYWRVQGNKDKAREYLQRALAAPSRPGREVADAGRRREVQEALHELGG